MRWPLVGFAYVVLGAVSLLAAWWRGVSPLSYPTPLLEQESDGTRLIYSALVGAAIAALAVALTRALVGRVEFITRLHDELRPLTHMMSGAVIVMLAVTSAFGEELLFRGLLQPWIGLWAQALIFGALHQVGGPSRWVWMTWATLMGLAFGAMYWCTGSLVGPFISHAAINGFNLVHLRDYDPRPPQKRLGGLLSFNDHRGR